MTDQVPLAVGDTVTVQGVITGENGDYFIVNIPESFDVFGLLDHTPEILVPKADIRRNISPFLEEPK